MAQTWVFVNLGLDSDQSYWANNIPEALQPLFAQIHGCGGAGVVLWREGDSEITVHDLLHGLEWDIAALIFFDFKLDDIPREYLDEDKQYFPEVIKELRKLHANLTKYCSGRGVACPPSEFAGMYSGQADALDIMYVLKGTKYLFFQSY